MKEKFIIKRVIFITGLVVLIFALIFISRKISSKPDSDNFTEVKNGSFEIIVSATGELYAENSVDIKGPILPTTSNRRGRRRGIRAMDLKILDIIPEGTIVNKGDYIAQLDRTSYENTLKDEIERLETMQTNLEMQILDSSMTLTGLRDDIKNQGFEVEVATVTLEKSVYEPPTAIRQAEITLDKAKRSLIQKKKTYELRLTQEIKEINDIRLDISRQIRMIEDLKTYLEGFTITSPADGMVVYKRNWNGTKRKVGSNLNPFDMVVATLPDLSTMISKTYVSEIDIRKVKPGQKVNIRVDAFRKKPFSGTVLNTAKIGEKLPNSDTKMFEVTIRINEYDPSLRPSMTTGNEIITRSFDNVVYVPLECVRADAGGITYVYTKDKRKQIVILGEANDKNIIIEKGLNPGTQIYLTRPGKEWKYKMTGEELLSTAYKLPKQ
jgi:HlyD family secretion protein